MRGIYSAAASRRPTPTEYLPPKTVGRGLAPAESAVIAGSHSAAASGRPAGMNCLAA